MVPGVDEIRPEMLKTLDIVGLSWLTAHSVLCGGQRQYLWSGRPGCAPIIGVSHCSASPGKFIPGCWKGGSGRLSNFSFRRNVDSVLAVERWTSSLLLQGCWGALWTWRRLMAVFPRESCGGYCGNWYEPFGPCTTNVRAVSIFSAQSQARSQ